MSDANLEETWRTLAGLGEGERRTRMRAELEALAGADAAAITAAMHAVLGVEAELAEAQQHDLTRSRLQIWAEMDETAARRLSESVEAARETLPGGAAMRSTSAVQTVLRVSSRWKWSG